MACPQPVLFGHPVLEVFMPRMRILSSSEQETFDAPPRLDHGERKRFLILPGTLVEAVRGCATPPARSASCCSAGTSRRQSGSSRLTTFMSVTWRCRKSLKRNQEERNPETRDMKFYGGIGTYVRLGPMLAGRRKSWRSGIVPSCLYYCRMSRLETQNLLRCLALFQ